MLRRSLTIPITALALASAAAAPAGAAGGSIVYVKDQNVWLGSPDGSAQRQVTTDGAAGPYVGPSAKDDGTIVVAQATTFSTFTPEGVRVGGPFRAGATTTGCPATGPFDGQVEPQGNRITYWWMWHSCVNYLGFTPYITAAFADRDTAPTDFAQLNPYTAPRWVIPTGAIAAVKRDGSGLVAQNAAGAMQEFLTADPGETLQAFDIARDGQRILLLSAADTNSPGTLRVWNNAGIPPAAGGATVCTLSPFGSGASKPRWSPDGTQITWADGQGVWVAPAPSGAGVCTVNGTLIAAGGITPSWGAANAPGTTGTGTPGADTTGPADTKKPKGRVQLATRTTLRRALSTGLKLKVTSDEAGAVRLQVVLGGKDAKRLKLVRRAKATTVASGKATFTTAGTKTITARFTKKARTRLRTAKRLRFTLKLTVTDAAGNRGTASKIVTLRR